MTIEDLIEGLQIIAAQQPGTTVDVHSGKLFAGEYKPRGMDAEGRARLQELGWDEDEGSWAIET